jgi:Family of unknown function (DUF6077)
MSRFHIRIDAACGGLMLLLGFWALYAQACILARVSFTTLRAFSFLPLLVTALVLWKTSRRVQPHDASAPDAPRTPRHPFRGGVMRFGVPFAIATLYAIRRSDWLFWLLATSYLTAETWFGQQDEAAPHVCEVPESRFELGALLALCALAGLLTSGTRLPDGDDAYFLNVATAAIEFPDAAPQSFDALHRSGLPPVEQALHLPQVYEILVALLSSVSGMSAPMLYYVVLPPLWAVLGTLANWLVLRHFLPPRQAIWGTAVFVLVLVFWGDGYRTFGYLGFVWLFMGKAIYLTVALPLIVLAALRYRQRPSVTTWLSLACSQFAAAGLTTNGVVVAPLAAALAVVARPRFDARLLRTMFVGVAASLPLIIVAAALYVRMAPYLSAVNVDRVLLGYRTTLGTKRAPLVLLALTLLPVLAAHARLKRTEWIAGYVWNVVLVICMPAVSILATHALGHVFSWRLFWAVPMPLLVSLAGGIAAGAIGARRWLPAGALAAWAVAFALAGSAAVSCDVFSLKNLGHLKVDDTRYAVAETTVALARSDAPALVPEPVAVYVTGFPHAPPLVGVRALYLRKLQGFIPDEERTMRTALLSYSAGTNPAMPVADALKAIDAEGIATVVFPERHRDARALVAALTERGFAIQTMHGFVIAARPK